MKLTLKIESEEEWRRCLWKEINIFKLRRNARLILRIADRRIYINEISKPCEEPASILEKNTSLEIKRFFAPSSEVPNAYVNDICSELSGTCLTIHLDMSISLLHPDCFTDIQCDNHRSYPTNSFYVEKRADYYLDAIRDLLIRMFNWDYLPSSPWFPCDGWGEYLSFTAYLVLNISSLNGIYCTENLEMQHLQSINEYLRVLKNYNPNNIREYEENPDGDANIYHLPPRKNIQSVGQLLGLYLRVEDADALQHLRDRYDKELFKDAGNYIFLCPANIETFRKGLKDKLCPGDQDGIDDRIKQHRIPHIDSLEELLYKLVFLHEVGHMAFSRPSRSIWKKQAEEETLANWFASISLTKLERDMIKTITELQPMAYRDYFTKEEYPLGAEPDIDRYEKDFREKIERLVRK